MQVYFGNFTFLQGSGNPKSFKSRTQTKEAPMPMPWNYRQATREWHAFLAEAREAMNLTSDNAAYTAV